MYAISAPDAADRAIAQYGLCVGRNARIWDGVRKTDSKFGAPSYKEAKAICVKCPVRQMCEDKAVETGDISVMRGGKTPAQLKRLVAAKEEAEKPRIVQVAAEDRSNGHKSAVRRGLVAL